MHFRHRQTDGLASWHKREMCILHLALKIVQLSVTAQLIICVVNSFLMHQNLPTCICQLKNVFIHDTTAQTITVKLKCIVTRDVNKTFFQDQDLKNLQD